MKSVATLAWAVVALVALQGCSYDFDTIESTCGNGILDTDEACDGSELGTNTCISLGYPGGILSCTSGCTLDTSECEGELCGNGFTDPGEQCDGADLAEKDCELLGFGPGDLACSGQCLFDTSGCGPLQCGGGIPCPLSTLMDNFDDGVMGAEWDYWASSGAAAYESGGELVLAPSDGESGSAGYTTIETYDLRNSQLTIEITRVPNQATSVSGKVILVSNNEQNFLSFTVAEHALYVTQDLGGVLDDLFTTVYDPVDHQFWRLSEVSGQLFWDTSADGLMWNNVYSFVTPIALNAIYLHLSCNNWEGSSEPDEIRFDNLNIFP